MDRCATPRGQLCSSALLCPLSPLYPWPLCLWEATGMGLQGGGIDRLGSKGANGLGPEEPQNHGSQAEMELDMVESLVT